jgi:release factor glutamine methyltransferase
VSGPREARHASGASDGAEPRTAREMLERGRAFLERKGIEHARLEAELLVAHALGLDRLGLFLSLDRPLERAEVARGRELLARRARHEPTAYVIGQREFYGREFRVGPGVLVPRPETELLVDRARARFAGRHGMRIADVGTGSGCLAITLALELAPCEVVASETSPRALEYARENAQCLGARVTFRHGSGLEALEPDAPFDLIVSNPPYVDPAVRDELAPEVREHEPSEALFAPTGEPDHWVELLIAEAPERLAQGGMLLVELGHDQAARLGPKLERIGAPWNFALDLARVARVLELGPVDGARGRGSVPPRSAPEPE